MIIDSFNASSITCIFIFYIFNDNIYVFVSWRCKMYKIFLLVYEYVGVFVGAHGCGCVCMIRTPVCVFEMNSRVCK